jgi:spermidine synthase
VIYARSTPYQRIVLTRRGDDMRLYLNGNLQFSTRDEYRYHEALVWPVLGRVADPRSVLILGGGDGLAAREVLSDARVRHVTLVDLDPEMTRLFRDTPQLVALNRASLSSPRITVVNADAFRWVRQARDRYDAVIVDFPDPTEFSLGKLYTESFYREVARLLAPAGVMTVQSTSPLGRAAILLDGGQHAGGRGPLRARISCLRSQLRRVGIYAGRAPSAGDAVTLPARMRFLTPASERAMFDFPPDMARRPTPVNRLDNQALVRSFALEWGGTMAEADG